MAAISKSEFVMDPSGFLSLSMLAEILLGHSTRHTMLWYKLDVLIQVPPAPIPDASMLPASEIGCPTSSFTCVGSFLILKSNVFQPRNYAYTLPFRCSVTILGWVEVIRLNGAHRPLPVGRPMAACHSLPTTFSKFLNGITRLRRVYLSLAMSELIFLVGRSMHRLAPSNTQPRISFHMSHSPLTL